MYGFINRVDYSVIWPPLRDSSADVSSFSPLPERIKELSVVGGLYGKLCN